MKKQFSWSRFKISKTYMIILGLSATLWFLFRVIPKPSRAKYPCMQAAAPIMSSFVIYMIAISASMFSFKKFKQSMQSSKHLVASGFLFLSVLSFAFIFLNDSKESIARALETVDETFPVNSNEPIGEAKGMFPGRVVWVHNDEATNSNFEPGNGDLVYNDDNTDVVVIKNMLESSLMQYTEKATADEAWDAIFKSHNNSKGRGEVGYSAGEKIAIKINLTNGSAKDDRADASPQLLIALLHELTLNAGVAQEDIILGDPYRSFNRDEYTTLKSTYPDVVYVDGRGGNGIIQTVATDTAVLFFAGPDDEGNMMESSLPTHYMEATYMINMPILKTHNEGGITLIAKNHQGSYLKPGDPEEGQYAIKMHYSLPANSSGTGKYRHTVDYMGHEQTGGKGLLYIVDAIWAGESWQGYVSKFKSYPFNDDYPSSIFIGQDPVALESVCFDVLFEEYATDDNKSDYPLLYKEEIADMLSQCASSDYWPAGITYDPEGDGTPLKSLGVFEHWNNPIDRQYSRNLGTGEGIELKYKNLNEPGQTQNDTCFAEVASIPVVVDAKADDACWADAVWRPINQVWMPFGAVMDEGDFEGKFKVSWDENYLYMLFEIVDDSLSDDHIDPLDSWWADDCLEVFIDENRSKGDHTNNNNAFAYHVSLSYDAIDLSPEGSGINYKDHVIVKRETIGEHKYMWEMAFKIYDESYDHSNPEASLQVLKANQKIGLAVAYCDNDETQARENFIGSMVMTAATNNEMYQNADHFGLFVLNDAANPNSAPVCTDYEFSIEENSPKGTLVGTVVASDIDGDNLQYSLSFSDLSNAFSIDETTGELIVNNEDLLDFETVQSVTLEIEVSDGIAKVSSEVVISITDIEEVGINDNEILSFKVYPNPNNGVFTIQRVNNESAISKVELYSNNGALMSTKSFGNTSTQKEVLVDFSKSKQGMYFVKIYTETNVVVKTLNIQ
ncbi:MAG: DUF362 domain-containing protein [Salinivirgaceae bacterium]|jgi:hypothetical protein|nr:DUF362 domain-containing protein [Salinivirgaceae bacterium]